MKSPISKRKKEDAIVLQSFLLMVVNGIEVTFHMRREKSIK